MIYAAILNASALSTAHRPRASVRAGRVTFRKADEYASWLVAIRLQVRRPSGWPLDERYQVRLAVWPPDGLHRDADNCAKGLLDALQWPKVGRRKAKTPHISTLWCDDSQVRVVEVVIAEPDRAHARIALLASVGDVGNARARLLESEACGYLAAARSA